MCSHPLPAVLYESSVNLTSASGSLILASHLMLPSLAAASRVTRHPIFFYCHWRLRRWMPSLKTTSPHDGPSKLHNAGLDRRELGHGLRPQREASTSTQPSQDRNSVFICELMQPELASNDTQPRKLEPDLSRDRAGRSTAPELYHY